MIDRLRAVLTDLGVDASPEEIADVLWLAQRVEAAPAEPAEQGEPVIDDGVEEPAEQSIPQRDPPADVAPEEPASYYGATRTRAPQGLESRPVRVPSVRAITDMLAIARALKPLKKKVPSSWRNEIDLAATVAAIAETDVVDVALRPADERWLDLVVVVDQSVSMQLWQQVADEFGVLLRRLGTFRDIRTFGMDASAATGVRLRSTPFAASSSERSPQAVFGPPGRTAVLVLTDGAGAAWHGGGARRQLEEWARYGPIAVVQTLPPRLWDGTGTSAQRFDVRSPSAAGRNQRWEVGNPLIPAELAPRLRVPVPVLEIDAPSLRRWARLVSGTDLVIGVPLIDASAWTTPAAARPVAGLKRREGTAAQAESSKPEPESKRLLRAFREAASPEAFRLAAYLSSISPLTLPVMRTVQDVLPETTRTHLAEVFLGGLLRRTEQEGVFDFRADVRPALLSTLDPEAAFGLTAAVGARIKQWQGGGPEASALRSGSGGHVLLPKDARPFAVSSAPLLEHLGAFENRVEPVSQDAGPLTSGLSQLDGELSPYDWDVAGDFSAGSGDAVAPNAPPPKGIASESPGRHLPAARAAFADGNVALSTADYERAEAAFQALLTNGLADDDRSEQAWGYDGLGRVALARGHHVDALVALRNAAELQSELAASHPGEEQAYLAELLEAISGCLSTMSRHAEAVQSQRQARAVYQELAITDPRYLAQLSQATSTLNDRLTRAQSASGEQTAAADRASTVTWQDVTGTFRTLRAGHVWSFSSHDVTSGRLHVELSSATFPSLRWRQGRRRRDTTVAEPHLTLGCLFELTNGTRGLIHEPTEQEVDAYRQWPYTKVPFDWLYRDVDVEDRITLDLGHAMDLRRLLFFAVIRSEAFHRADARMTFVVDRQAALAIRLEQAPRSAQSCAVALLSRHRKELVLHSELHYSPGDPSTLDERYGWGLDWSENELPGSSRP